MRFLDRVEGRVSLVAHLWDEVVMVVVRLGSTKLRATLALRHYFRGASLPRLANIDLATGAVCALSSL